MSTFEVVESFEWFQKEGRSCDLHPFPDRVCVKSITLNDASSVYPPWCFDFFEEMLKKMSQEEKSKNYRHLSKFYRRLLDKFCRRSPHRREMLPFLRRTFSPLLGLARAISIKSDVALLFVVFCRSNLVVSPSDFLGIASREDFAFVSGCLSFNFPSSSGYYGWSIQNNRALMRALESEKDHQSSVPLIQYGFQYMSDKMYFIARAVQLFYGCGRVKGIKLCWEISFSILSCCKDHIRLQMALELLVTLFDDTKEAERELRNKNILGLLWQAVPFPYISSSEMFTLLKPFYKGERLKLKEVCHEYKKHNKLFKVPDVSEPRSLQHLSKVQIRKTMCDAKTISDETIDSLNIPWLLKDYLKLPFYKYYS